MKNVRIFYLKNCHFLVVKFLVYLNRRVFVMKNRGWVVKTFMGINAVLKTVTVQVGRFLQQQRYTVIARGEW